MPSKKFIKVVEDFNCENCGLYVHGQGFTNHCTECLYSKHVDINPGDRMEECLGIMKPIGVEVTSGDHIIIHECEHCLLRKKNKASPNDNFNTIIYISVNRNIL